MNEQNDWNEKVAEYVDELLALQEEIAHVEAMASQLIERATKLGNNIHKRAYNIVMYKGKFYKLVHRANGLGVPGNRYHLEPYDGIVVLPTKEAERD